MIILAALTKLSKAADAIRQKIRICGDCTTVAGRRKILARMKAEASNVPEAAGSAVMDAGTMGLCHILDNRKAAFPCQLNQSCHWSRLPVEMHWKNGHRPGCND